MSSSEDNDVGPKPKRKLRRIDSSPASTFSESPIINSCSVFKNTRSHNVIPDSEFSSSSSGSPILTNPKRKRVNITDSDSDSSDDSLEIIGRVRLGKPRRLENDDSFSSQRESDSENVCHPETNASSTAQNNNSDSEFSDGQSQKCPICLISLEVQETGTPKSCDHVFCLECIQEWSKNMNTCPIDRQEYELILVRDRLNGKVTRQIPIKRPVPQNEVDIFEDTTDCEICGSTDHGDRMLLCDGCDLGFHLFCLTPPLNEVPTGSWYCDECGGLNESSNFDSDVSEFLLEDYTDESSQESSQESD